MNLLEYKKNVKSHDGEDGIIEQIFTVVGIANKWVVELGAINGTRNSNSWNLIQNKGWSAVLIEGDPTYFEKLAVLYAGHSNIFCFSDFVAFEGPTSLDAVFARTPIPHDFDLLSLDIDGNDYHVWDALSEYRPRVVCIEYNSSIPNHVDFVQPKDMSVFQGSSLRAIVRLARAKGYELVCVSSPNAFFVLKELFPKFDISDTSIEVLNTDTSNYTYLYQLYDGTLKLDGCTTFLWRDGNVSFDEKKIQPLSARERVYGARVSNYPLVRQIKFVVRKSPFYPLLQKMRKTLLQALQTN